MGQKERLLHFLMNFGSGLASSVFEPSPSFTSEGSDLSLPCRVAQPTLRAERATSGAHKGGMKITKAARVFTESWKVGK